MTSEKYRIATHFVGTQGATLALYRTAIRLLGLMLPDPSARYLNPLIKIVLAFGAGLMIAALL